jgi:colanic acid/amylovoran biosynthesis glycosyltransferase
LKVLFWTSQFPTYSETFIRDQVITLINKNVNVYIYSHKVSDEPDSLKGFERYKLQTKIINGGEIFPQNKIIRILKTLWVLLCSIGTTRFTYYIKCLNVNKYGYKAKSLKLFFLIDWILKNEIDIIHAHFGPNGNDAALIKEIGLPIKLFTTFHGYDIRLGIEKGSYVYDRLYKQANGVLSISDYNYKHLLEFGFEKEKIIKLANGIDVNFFQENKNKIKNQVNLLTVARLVPEKALHISIKALHIFLKENPNVSVCYKIIGEGPLRNELQRLIESLNLEKTIQLLGAKKTHQVKELMASSDVFFLSSVSEALPTVILEAQSSGLVILATDVGSVRSMVKGGLVVDSNNENAFSEGIKELFKKKSEWVSMKKEGRAHVIKHHNLDVQTEKLINIYKS